MINKNKDINNVIYGGKILYVGVDGATMALQALNLKFGGSISMLATCLCPWARHFIHVVSLYPGVQVGTWKVRMPMC